MKKRLLILVLPFFLISCGMNEAPDKVLMKNQSEVLWNITKFSSEMSEWEQLWKIKADFVKEKWEKTNINLEYKLNIDSENKKSWWNLSWEIDWIWSWSGKNSIVFDLDFVNTGKKLYSKLNKNINYDIWSLMWMEWIKFDSLINKWVYLDLPAENSFDVNKYSDLLNIVNKYQLFKLVKKNEDKEFYNYDVTLNPDSMVNIANDYSISLSWSWLTEEDKKWIIDDLTKNPFNWNIKINPKNKQYFIFTSNMDKTLVKIENSKEMFNISVNEEWNKNWFNLEFKKDWNNFNWTLLVKEEDKEVVKWDVVLKLEKDNISIKWKVDVSQKTFSPTWEEKNEKFTFNFDVNIKTDKDKKITVEEPKDAKNIQEVIMQMMWLWWAMDNLQNTQTWELSNLTWSIEKNSSTVTGSIDTK